ncbi:MAG: hypothetical protein HUJ11_08035 [Arenibacter algicola]|nr:hypothetical protein [Arenibacter algicola]
MRAPIIINNSRDMYYADLDVFRTVQDAEMYNESWDVDEPYFAYDADGLRLEMVPNEKDFSVILRPLEERPSGTDVLKQNLRDYLQMIAETKGWDFAGVTPESLERATLNELLEVSLKFSRR